MLDYIYYARSAPPGAPPRRLSTDARSPLACPISFPPKIKGREASPSSSTSPTAAANASPLLPEIRGKLCVGSQFGWLAVLDEFSNVSLLNLLIRSQIHLPPITTLPFIEPIHDASDGGALSMYLFHEQLFWPAFGTPLDYPIADFRRISISKVVLSSSPTGSGSDSDRFTVVAIFDFTKLILFIRTSLTYWMSERSTGSATSSMWISAATPQKDTFR